MAASVVKKEYLPDDRPMLFLKGQEEWGQRSRVEVEQHHNFPKLLKTMEAMKRLVGEEGLKIVIVVLSACERTHLLCFDAKLYLMQAAGRLLASGGELLWSRDDTHLGERGHEILAQFTVAQILERPPFSLTEGAAKPSRPSVER